MPKIIHSRKDILKRVPHSGASNISLISDADLAQYNPTLKSIRKVEELFKENIEFDSKNQILRKLDGSMKAPVLNIILKYLKELGKILDNEDGSWTWIYAADNAKLKKRYKEAKKL